MITYIEGKVIDTSAHHVVVVTAGIGYTIYTNIHPKVFSTIELWTYHHVSSDYQHSLYGFNSQDERGMFLTLLKVQGIGPKIAQKIIVSGNMEDLESAITKGNITYFTRVKGLGKKGAQKIILELKNTLLFTNDSDQENNNSVAIALQDLGFTKGEISRVFSKLEVDKLEEEELLKESLKLLGP